VNSPSSKRNRPNRAGQHFGEHIDSASGV
jgi:hypothetical protein